MPACPAVPLEMVEPESVFELPIVPLDPPPALGQADEVTQGEPLAAETGQPDLVAVAVCDRSPYEANLLAGGQVPIRRDHGGTSAPTSP